MYLRYMRGIRYKLKSNVTKKPGNKKEKQQRDTDKP